MIIFILLVFSNFIQTEQKPLISAETLICCEESNCEKNIFYDSSEIILFETCRVEINTQLENNGFENSQLYIKFSQIEANNSSFVNNESSTDFSVNYISSNHIRLNKSSVVPEDSKNIIFGVSDKIFITIKINIIPLLLFRSVVDEKSGISKILILTQRTKSSKLPFLVQSVEGDLHQFIDAKYIPSIVIPIKTNLENNKYWEGFSLTFQKIGVNGNNTESKIHLNSLKWKINLQENISPNQKEFEFVKTNFNCEKRIQTIVSSFLRSNISTNFLDLEESTNPNLYISKIVINGKMFDNGLAIAFEGQKTEIYFKSPENSIITHKHSIFQDNSIFQCKDKMEWQEKCHHFINNPQFCLTSIFCGSEDSFTNSFSENKSKKNCISKASEGCCACGGGDKVNTNEMILYVDKKIRRIKTQNKKSEINSVKTVSGCECSFPFQLQNSSVYLYDCASFGGKFWCATNQENCHSQKIPEISSSNDYCFGEGDVQNVNDIYKIKIDSASVDNSGIYVAQELSEKDSRIYSSPAILRVIPLLTKEIAITAYNSIVTLNSNIQTLSPNSQQDLKFAVIFMIGQPDSDSLTIEELELEVESVNINHPINHLHHHKSFRIERIESSSLFDQSKGKETFWKGFVILFTDPNFLAKPIQYNISIIGKCKELTINQIITHESVKETFDNHKIDMNPIYSILPDLLKPKNTQMDLEEALSLPKVLSLLNDQTCGPDPLVKLLISSSSDAIPARELASRCEKGFHIDYPIIFRDRKKKLTLTGALKIKSGEMQQHMIDPDDELCLTSCCLSITQLIAWTPPRSVYMTAARSVRSVAYLLAEEQKANAMIRIGVCAKEKYYPQPLFGDSSYEILDVFIYDAKDLLQDYESLVDME